jgi:hypothetical protein
MAKWTCSVTLTQVIYVDLSELQVTLHMTA